MMKIKSAKHSFYFGFAFAVLFSGCTKKSSSSQVTTKPSANCDSSQTISYNKQIVPILNTYCGTNSGGCHSAISSFGDLTNYTGVKVHLPNMILHCVLQDDPVNYKPMPLVGPKLSACDIAIIRNWINQGYSNN